MCRPSRVSRVLALEVGLTLAPLALLVWCSQTQRCDGQSGIASLQGTSSCLASML